MPLRHRSTPGAGSQHRVTSSHRPSATYFVPSSTTGPALPRVIGRLQHDFPVRSGGRLVGVLSHEALLAAVDRDGDNAPVGDAVKGQLITVDPSTPLARALELMRAAHATSAVVMHQGEPAGLLTAENVAERLVAQGRG